MSEARKSDGSKRVLLQGGPLHGVNVRWFPTEWPAIARRGGHHTPTYDPIPAEGGHYTDDGYWKETK